jgi:hypothetical protein
MSDIRLSPNVRAVHSIPIGFQPSRRVDLVVIARDKKLRSKPVEVRALWEHKLRVFNIGGKKDLPTWDWLARVVRHWTRMEEIISERGPGPWI